MGEFGALLAIVTVPVKLPVVVGAKTTLKLPVAPAAIDAGADVLLKALLPDVVTLEIERADVPVFFSATVCELLFPDATFPKATLEGVAEIAACNPVPLRATASGEFGALLTMDMLPVTLPGPVGVKTAEKVALPPAAIDDGSEATVNTPPVVVID